MEKILVIKHGALGDIILAMGAFKAIRDHHKNAHITLQCRRQFTGLGRDCGYFDAVELETMPKWFKPHEFLKRAKFFQQFDRVYDLQNNDRTGIYFSLIPRNKKPEWSGIQNGASLQINDPYRSQKHAFTLLKEQLAVAGIIDIQPDPLQWMTGDTDRFALPDTYALIVPGCSPTHPEKRWSTNNYIEICTYLTDKGVQPVLIGTTEEKTVLDDIEASVPNVINLCEATKLYDIPALARRAKLALGNDTGPVHMIALTGCPTIGLYQGAGDKWRRSTVIGENSHAMHGLKIDDISTQAVKEKISSL